MELKKLLTWNNFINHVNKPTDVPTFVYSLFFSNVLVVFIMFDYFWIDRKINYHLEFY